MKRATFFVLGFGGLSTAVLTWIELGEAPNWLLETGLPAMCALVGGIGGTAYCLRAVYIHVCLEDDWDDQWLPWYFIRPFVSLIVGGISYVFLRAGLLVLDAPQAPEGSNLGYLAIAFVAGLNVDGIMDRIEEIAKSTWGIRPSRMSRGDYKSGEG